MDRGDRCFLATEICTESFTRSYGSNGYGYCISKHFCSLFSSIGSGLDSVGQINDFVGRIAIMFMSMNDLPTKLLDGMFQTTI